MSCDMRRDVSSVAYWTWRSSGNVCDYAAVLDTIGGTPSNVSSSWGFSFTTPSNIFCSQSSSSTGLRTSSILIMIRKGTTSATMDQMCSRYVSLMNGCKALFSVDRLPVCLQQFCMALNKSSFQIFLRASMADSMFLWYVLLVSPSVNKAFVPAERSCSVFRFRNYASIIRLILIFVFGG